MSYPLPLLTAVLLALLASAPVPAAEGRPPNFIFFLVDDLGWADTGCYGSTFYETPHIDTLAASGMRFTQGYAACPVCSPTRASILTGRHPVRVGITDWIPGYPVTPEQNRRFLQVVDRDNLALEEVTVAELLREAGYRTMFAGKWHLGDQGHWPTDQGFDVNVAGNAAGSPPGGYYAPWNNPTLEAREEGEYLTERLMDEGVRFLEECGDGQPFLLYLSYYNVHTPITPYEKRIEHFQRKAAEEFVGPTPFASERQAKSRMRQDDPAYASMIAAVDHSVGEILLRVAELGLENDTVVIFFSDNGGLCTLEGPRGPTSNLPLRSGKGWLYEGGIREPMIIRAPGVTTPGAVCTAPVASMDFLPTILDLAGLPERPMLHTDGQNLRPLLDGGDRLQERTLYWHYPHYHGSTWAPGAAIRDGDWKLIEFYEEGRAELYNLALDPGEQYELSENLPQKATELRAKLHRWQAENGAPMPEVNPHYQAGH